MNITKIKDLETYDYSIKPHGNSALERWYDRFRETEVRSISIEDLCIVIRQHIFLPQMVPIAIVKFTKHPWSGYLYEGELLAALASIDKEFWEENKKLAAQLLNALMTKKRLPLEVRPDTVELKNVLMSVLSEI